MFNANVVAVCDGMAVDDDSNSKWQGAILVVFSLTSISPLRSRGEEAQYLSLIIGLGNWLFASASCADLTPQFAVNSNRLVNRTREFRCSEKAGCPSAKSKTDLR